MCEHTPNSWDTSFSMCDKFGAAFSVLSISLMSLVYDEKSIPFRDGPEISYKLDMIEWRKVLP